MTLGSSHTLLTSSTENRRTWGVLFRQLKPRSDQSCNILVKRPMEKKHPKAHRFRTCLMFRLKDRMEQKKAPVEPLSEGIEGTLRELALKWFTETQAPLILLNGLFPAWFQGFIARKDAEEALQDKQLGCFLIRLSDRAIGYILSYKGRDRCRHFVINQSKEGRFIVSGDIEGHNNLSDLIEHYKTSPIQPFGEYLTSSCFEAINGDLYDIIQVMPKEKPVVSVRAVKNIWNGNNSNRTTQQPTTVPPKSNRTPGVVRPLPRCSGPFKNSALDDESSAQGNVLYAHLKKHKPRGNPGAQPRCLGSSHGGSPGRTTTQTCQRENQSRVRPAVGSDTVYSELTLLDIRGSSMPHLDNNTNKRYRPSAASPTPPRLSPDPPRHNARRPQLQEQRPTGSHNLEYLRDESPVYCLAGTPGHQLKANGNGSFVFQQDSEPMYAEVPSEATLNRLFLDNTYEQIPEHGFRGATAQFKPNNRH